MNEVVLANAVAENMKALFSTVLDFLVPAVVQDTLPQVICRLRFVRKVVTQCLF